MNLANTFGILNSSIAQRAMDMCRPSIDALLKSDLSRRNALSVVVLNPTDGYETFLETDDFGNPDEMLEDFHEYALAKAQVSARCKMDSYLVKEEFPHLWVPGDITYGGAVYERGVVVGASGTQGLFDEMCARWVATTCIALCKKYRDEVISDPKDEVTYIK